MFPSIRSILEIVLRPVYACACLRRATDMNM